MSFTGKLGTNNSQLGNVELGVLGGPATQSVTSTLSLTDSATVDVLGVVNDTLSLSQAVVESADRPQSVSHTISFAQTPLGPVDHLQSVTSTLALVDTVATSSLFSRSVADTLSFVQTIHESIVIEVDNDVLAFVQTVGVIGPHYIDLRQPLGISDSAVAHRGDANVIVHDTLSLVSVAARQIPISVSHSLGLTSTGFRPTAGVDSLALGQTVSAGKGQDFLDNLNLTDTAVYSAVLIRQVADDLGLHHAETFLDDQSCLAWNYAPQVGSSSDGSITPPSTTAPTLSDGSLTLTYPFTSPSLTVALRNPAFDNKDSLNFTRINRQTLGGHLTVFADPIWPKLKTLTMPLVALRRPAVDNLVAFLQASAGKEIGLLDYENRQWRGVITNPDLDISETERNAHSLTLQFEGDLA